MNRLLRPLLSLVAPVVLLAASLPAPAGSLVQGTQRLSGALRTANPSGRRLFQAASQT